MAPGKSENQQPIGVAQLNIFTVVDVANILRTGSVVENVFMTDNSWHSFGRGTSHLSTNCLRGQVLNWLLRTMEHPQSAAWIEDIAFTGGQEVCTLLQPYPAVLTPDYTPMYYWAGMVCPTTPVDVYRYTLLLRLEAGAGSGYYPLYQYYPLHSPALNVMENYRPEDFEPPPPEESAVVRPAASALKTSGSSLKTTDVGA